MNENYSPSYPPPPPPAPGIGCYAKGCLSVFGVLLLIGIILAGGFWYVARNLTPYFSQERVAIRVFPATDEQYLAVRAKVDPFLDAARAGQAASVSLSADDLNILVARDPLLAFAREKVYFSITGHHVTAEVSLPIKQEMSSMPAQTLYFNGRAGFDASFAGGDFTMVLRDLEPLDGGPTPDFVTSLLANRNFSYSLTRSINDGFHDGLRKCPAQAEILSHVRRVIVKDGQVVVTSPGTPAAVAEPANPP